MKLGSRIKLDKVDKKLQDLFEEVDKITDIEIICGYRTEDEQNALYAKGRKVPGNIVTYAKFGDSPHNYNPSFAVDVCPSPIDWKDIDAFKKLSVIVKDIARKKKINITWGGDFNRLKDYPHWELANWKENRIAKNMPQFLKETKPLQKKSIWDKIKGMFNAR